MPVSKTAYGIFTTVEGTLAEVVAQLNTDGVHIQEVRIVYDSTGKCVAVYHTKP